MTGEWLLDLDLGEALHENEIEIAQQIAETIATTVLNGRTVAVTGSSDETARVWDLATGQRSVRNWCAPTPCREVAVLETTHCQEPPLAQPTRDLTPRHSSQVRHPTCVMSPKSRRQRLTTSSIRRARAFRRGVWC